MPLVGAATIALSAQSRAGTDSAQAPSPSQQPQEIVITAPPLFADLQPERALDEQGITSYGDSTVSELITDVLRDLGEDELPLLIVNGQRVNDLSEIGSLPVETLRNVVVLPRNSAVRLGGSPGQRVLSLTLKPKARTATVTAAGRVATDGGWYAGRGEAILTNIRNSTRANLALRVNGESSLLESQRGIIQPTPTTAYAQAGNIVGYPDLLSEIDPLLSEAAGQMVTVVPVPAAPDPTLAELVPFANRPATTDLGDFRTLRPQARTYDLSGSYSTRVASWLTAAASFSLNRITSLSKHGLPSAIFVLQPTNPASPFSTDVALTFYGHEPLETSYERNSGQASVTLDGNFGQWISNFNAKHAESKDETQTQRSAIFGRIPIDDSIDPFLTDLSQRIPIQTDRSTGKATANSAELSFTGPTVNLPAGPLQATIDSRASGNRLESRNDFTGEQRFRRFEASLRGAADIPLTSRDNDFLAQIGDLSLSADYTIDHYSDAGTLHDYAFGIVWEPRPVFRLSASIERADHPPTMQMLGNPIIVSPDVRVFDTLLGQTVDVVQITGGNSTLRPEKDKIRRVSGLLRLVPRLNLQLNAEYTDTDGRNYISYLPEASAAVMLAFPDRYIRNDAGELTTIDLRPVNFDTHREKRLRWGLSMQSRLNSGGTAAGPGRGPASPPTLLQLSLNQTVVFSDELTIRTPLPPVDLLGGGAIGIGGGRVRQQVDGSASLTRGGLGGRLIFSWRGKSYLDTRIGGTMDTLQFSPVFLVNLRMFTDGARIFGDAPWTRGLRLSANIVNLLNDRQDVRDSAGNTPLQYQPGYRDPLGRTTEIEIRKAF